MLKQVQHDGWWKSLGARVWTTMQADVDHGFEQGFDEGMIDNFSLLLTHGLILIACWRLLSRPDLDQENPVDNRIFRPRPREDRPDA